MYLTAKNAAHVSSAIEVLLNGEPKSLVLAADDQEGYVELAAIGESGAILCDLSSGEFITRRLQGTVEFRVRESASPRQRAHAEAILRGEFDESARS